MWADGVGGDAINKLTCVCVYYAFAVGSWFVRPTFHLPFNGHLCVRVEWNSLSLHWNCAAVCGVCVSCLY